MKLTNAQIESICNQAERRFNADAPPKPTLTKEEENICLHISGALLSLPDFALKELSGAGGSYNREKFRTAKFWQAVVLNQKAEKPKRFDRAAFRDRLHIASIDSTDLKQLCKKLDIKI